MESYCNYFAPAATVVSFKSKEWPKLKISNLGQPTQTPTQNLDSQGDSPFIGVKKRNSRNSTYSAIFLGMVLGIMDIFSKFL